MAKKPLVVREVSNHELQVTLLSRNELIREIRDRIREFASKNGFDDESIFDAQLAVNEALANVIEHAYQGVDRGRIDIQISADEQGALVVSIRDYGLKADPESIRSRDLDKPEDGGLGVFLIKKLMDEVRYDHSPHDGTVLVLKKYKKHTSRGSEHDIHR